jgi:predicted DNA-binding transcriptional regulator YafY
VSKVSDQEGKIKVSLFASPNAMEHWAMQYLNYVEVTSPQHLRERIRESLNNGIGKYS